MASSLFGSQPNPMNNNMLQQFNEFKRQFGNGDPKAAVEELLKSGKMTK